MIDLENKVAVVTGATGGIGNAIASSLAKKRVKLCLVSRKIKKLKDLQKKLSQYSSNVAIFKADFTNEEDVKSISSFVEEEFGKADILIHTAGVLSMEAIENATFDSLNLHFKVNYFAPYLITQSLLPTLKANHGQIVFINSSAIQRAIPDLAQYSSSKFALKGLADTLREEVNPYGVRVLSIYPGQTATSMQKKIYKEKGNIYKPERLLQPEEIADVVIHALMLSSTAEITEIFIRPMLKNL
jgi:short-subunit dehydrogenase